MRVLLVEDEVCLREVIRDFLEMEGYRIYEASNGIEAIKKLEEIGGHFEAIITDNRMPIMNGRCLLDILKNSHIHFKNRILMSADQESLKDLKDTHFLQKPFLLQNLSSILKGN